MYFAERCVINMRNKLFYFLKALSWIKNNTIDENGHGKGITVTSEEKIIYPEVTGYYIPTLLTWGERDLALAYAKYLCNIQKQDGSWYDSGDREPYVFDSAQILKGLIAIRDIMPEVDGHIIKGCDWILSNMQSNGRLTTPCKDAWGDNEDFCSELIHVYCLTPIRDAGKIFNKLEYLRAVDKILDYYKREKFDRIEKFSLLSHFYAYVMEGLYDLGEVKLCRNAMMKLEKYRNKNGAIPGLNDVPWVCSTGLFQLAVVWYKLGDLERGNSLFYYALTLQNKSGGWYGSYATASAFARFYRGRKRPYYFPDAEISWANKYFLDALALKEKLEFEKQSSIFLDEIDDNDGRYILIKNLVIATAKKNGMRSINVCDVGCGKGRYLKKLSVDCPNNEYFATDLSERVMLNIEGVKEKKVGSLTCIPYDDNSFEVVYTCEAFEHAINLHGSFGELYRIVKPGGTLIIVDKPLEKLGQLEIYEWEQWIDDADIYKFTEECSGKLEIVKSISYENKDDGLFRAWIVRKNS